MGFWPYFLQEKSSAGISAFLLLIAGTLITLFILNLLFLEQWQLLPDLHLRASSMELHFRFMEEEIGGFPEDGTWEGHLNWKLEETEGCLLSESPVTAELGGEVENLMFLGVLWGRGGRR